MNCTLKIIRGEWQGYSKKYIFDLDLQFRRPGFDPWVRKIPWRREWQPTPLFLPGEFHGQRMTGYGSWGHKESDMTEQLIVSLFLEAPV